MAIIDKTYAKTWEEFESLVEWAKDKEFICPNGMKLYPINYIYEYNKDYYEISYEFPVMNTPKYMDYFLIKECPLDFVQNRMKEVYDGDYIRNVLNGNSEFDTYKRDIGTKVKIIKYSKFGNKGKLCEKKKRMKFIEVDYLHCGLYYNEVYDYWISLDELGYYTSNVCHKNINSTKAMIRQIKKWKLPKGSVVIWSGRYVGNEFKFLVC